MTHNNCEFKQICRLNFIDNFSSNLQTLNLSQNKLKQVIYIHIIDSFLFPFLKISVLER